MLVRSGAVDIIVVDSVAALTPKAELEGEMGDSHVGLQARLMSQALRKLTGSLNKSKTMMMFINQLRMKIGVMFGSPETTTGGNALKFYASMRLDIRRIGAIKQTDKVVGNRTRVKVVKNKLAPPFREIEFDISYGEGVSREGLLIDMGVDANVVDKVWCVAVRTRASASGRAARTPSSFSRSTPDVAKRIEDEVLEKAGNQKGGLGRRGRRRGGCSPAACAADSGAQGKAARMAVPVGLVPDRAGCAHLELLRFRP